MIKYFGGQQKMFWRAANKFTWEQWGRQKIEGGGRGRSNQTGLTFRHNIYAWPPLGNSSADFCYRPQTKFAKVMFLQVSVCPQGGHAWLLAGGRHVWLLWGGHAWLLGGACMVAPGGHAWLLQGGVCGCSLGVCVVVPGGSGMCGCSRGRAWLLPGWGVCIVAPGGACVVFSMRYGQWVGGTHPTGMHSCNQIVQSDLKI